MRDATNTLMEFERTTSATGGRALVAIIMPSTGTPNEADTNFAVQHLQIIREEVPGKIISAFLFSVFQN